MGRFILAAVQQCCAAVGYPPRLVRADPARWQGVQFCAGLRKVAKVGQDDRPSKSCAQAVGPGHQQIAKHVQRAKVQPPRDRTLDMDRLEGRLALVAPEPARARGRRQQCFRLDDLVLVPQPGILSVQWHEATCGIPARLSACGAGQHQGEKSLRLWLFGHLACDQPRQPDRLASQGIRGIRGIRGVQSVPAMTKGRMDRVKYSLQPFGQVLWLRNGEAQACIADVGPGADQLLRQSGGLDKECARWSWNQS